MPFDPPLPNPGSGHLGGAWLVERFEIKLVQQLPVQSRIGGRRATRETHGVRVEIYAPGMNPGDTLPGHLTFHLKHEGVHLELLARLFDVVDPQVIADWVTEEPTGQYARRTAFFYEWLTDKHLALDESVAPGGNYVDALDPRTTMVATTAVNNSVWRVRDNMPGTREYCPMVRWTDASRRAATFDVARAFEQQEAHFGAEILRRSAVWMTLKESRSSFLIEGEQDQTRKIQRFAAVMETRTGQGASPLTEDALAALQKDILGTTTTLQSYGLRKSPVFVGEQVRYDNVVHYVAPPWQEVPAMVRGLQKALALTAGQEGLSVGRAAVAAFGFVYIHPMADGNGRIHRFLINDVLRRDGAVHAPFILPVSALITDSARERAGYDSALEAFSKPLMAAYAHACVFAATPTVQEDGVASNFSFTANDEAMPAWRYPDLTRHVEYLGGVIQRTIEQEMHLQARFFRSHDQARRTVKDVIEGPDSDIDAIIRSVQQNKGQLSGKLLARFPALDHEGVWERIVQAVTAAFRDAPNDEDGAPSNDTQRPLG